jgi:BirA family transcriptional regulator, biotin operon repressor / biotin---[acetyl-CoA-carboxylase] ligase
MNTQNNNLDASNVLLLCTNSCFGHVRYIYSPTTGSTNDDAHALADAGAPHGTVVVTDHQTAGRGRHDRNWESPPNCGIYASLLLRPDRPLQHAPLLGIAAAVAAVQAIQSVAGVHAQIKWPNDILLHKRKIAGVLTETDLHPEGSYVVIIGLGINVNTPYTALPSRIIFPASSIQIELGHAICRPLLLAAWLNHMESLYQHWHNGNHAVILAAWHQHAYGIGKTLSIEQQDKITTGILQGMSDDGSLLLKIPTGDIIRILSGDVASTSVVCV